MLQTVLPPWAHPTPSPSMMMRHPDTGLLQFGCSAASSFPPSLSAARPPAGSNDDADSPPVSPVLQEKLWDVCMPFFQQMLLAVQLALQQEIQARVDRAMAEQRSAATSPPPSNVAPGRHISHEAPAAAVLASPKSNPFGALFNGAAVARGQGPNTSAARSSDAGQVPFWVTRRFSGESAPGLLTSAGVPEAVQESDEDDDGEDDEDEEDDIPSPKWRDSASKTPPSSEDTPGTGSRQGSLAASGNTGKDWIPNLSSRMSHHNREVERELADATGSNRPLYLAWSEEQPWGQQLTPTVSPVMPKLHPSAARQGPTALPQAAAGEASSDEEAGNSRGSKSAMVCRHWKSKGWCRLEDKCKFIHPEHKRGPVPASSSRRGPDSVAANQAVHIDGQTSPVAAYGARSGPVSQNQPPGKRGPPGRGPDFGSASQIDSQSTPAAAAASRFGQSLQGQPQPKQRPNRRNRSRSGLDPETGGAALMPGLVICNEAGLNFMTR